MSEQRSASKVSAWAIAMGLAMIPFQGAIAQDSSCYLIDENGQQVDLGALCGGGGSGSSSRNRNVFSAPIVRRVSGIPVIAVTFNGRETFDMLLDTGASSIAIPPNVAQQVGFQIEGTTRVSTPSDRSVQLPVGRVGSVEAAGITARDVRVIVTPALELGLLGQSFFGSYDVIIRQNVVEFRRR